ncbi:2-dehydro-3-deoxy-phosphogluconate aldolase [Lentibacillus sp. JNUCC-1]|uniref:bifunctional 4-hydroxy-2-oxoglutarate aldolase/2-dehydro-3-deoxy-phosphogluconate aldolase n=1 Tax=Lentibacillus sp. JNUCC-1 TaxID=2654513 RepID=UPI0012E901F3|nr:bifunctional 4-hydroxy-2-oxoglutarate aldolase/2-dehydro-3-deoxy-phosphogluconate aldolase [Lentibacillus sp. JNUCC-1]MUV37060.1 2-dehydro-3-deoxy-phosphogluconate aldolase [Lentibacillus sp. JNUCC-1]
MDSVINQIKKEKIVSIIRGNSADELEATVESLYKGGIRIVEITMNTPGAIEGIENISKSFPDLIVGAGTVLDPETARNAILAGADFLLAPTLNIDTLKLATRYNVLCVPGVLTPTEALTAHEHGARMIKVFPVRALGPSYISDIKAPLNQLEIMAVGGVSLSNAREFLKAGCCSLGIGSSLVDNQSVYDKDFINIEEKAKRFVELAGEFNL